MKQCNPRNSGSLRYCCSASAFAAVMFAAGAISPAAAGGEAAARGAYCTQTAKHVHRACTLGVTSDYWLARAVCVNESDREDRKECFEEAWADRGEARQECLDQLDARAGSCITLGEERYNPDFDEENFIADFTAPARTNDYYPLGVGSRWEFEGGTQTIAVEVLPATKLIDDVRCVVVRDVVNDEGALIEATDDWFAQALNGDVWYCGEEAKDYETFADDDPVAPELVEIGGSFKAGRDGAQAGVIFPGRPVVGQSYREEFSLGNAEDVADVLSITYEFGVEAELDRFVPERLARLFCNNDCVVTNNYSLLEPGVEERKYYAAGVGVFLEIHMDDGAITQLVGCNVDSRCDQL